MKKNNPKLICIIGVDGVGKTTHAQKLVGRLESDGVRCKYTWFRFYHFLSLLLLAYCRLVNLTVYEYKNGYKIGHQEFYRSKIVSFLYPLILFIDMLPMYFIKIFIPLRLGYTVICDRFVYDTLVDFMIALDDFKIHKKAIGKLYLMLIPTNTKTIILDLNEEIIRERREDLMDDQSLKMRRRAYHQIAKDFCVPILENTKSIEEIQTTLIDYFMD